MKSLLRIILIALALGLPLRGFASITYEPGEGAGKGKHIVFLTGDEEYRSEEGLPMLAKILSQRHGFKCTVLFALDPDDTINPDNTKSLDGAEALDDADLIVMLVRFRAWPDAQMKHFVDAYKRGVPIVALRTSTHAFKYDDPSAFYFEFNTFGKRVLGEQWVSHWGKHKVEACRGVIEPSAKGKPLLNGVEEIFADSDVYEAYPPADAEILVRGQVLKGMKPDDPPADYVKKRANDGKEQPVNDPMMPVAWTRVHRNENGKENRIFCTTMGAATDLQSEGLRRLIVNAVYAGLGLDVPAKADVRYIDEYKPTMYGFKGFIKGVKPADLAIRKTSRLRLNPGDRIVFVGNTLADRMQHHGHLETLIHAAFPGDNLVIRNLAVAGDEVVTRHRSENFGSPSQWLDKVDANVVFAFFGFNESFRGETGLAGFKAELDAYVKETLAKRQIVLFAPVATDHPAIDNRILKLYAETISAVAADNGVQFVDLFTPTLDKPLTFNGMHLTEAGDAALAPVIFDSLFARPPPVGDHEKLLAAVLEKNREWHARYRTVDGYNVYGGRSKLSFPSTQPGKEITNFHVMQEEMTQRDVITANCDKFVWAAARGERFVIEDPLPPVTPVPTNKPGPATSEGHEFLSGEEAIAKMKVHSNCTVNLFASEEQFPELINPVQMAWDTRGRLWIAVWPSYPERTPTSTIGDKLLILEDTDADGRADRCSTFLDDLNCPTGFQFYANGVLVMQAPDLWFVRDSDGDGCADFKERVLMGLDSADTHHTTNSMCYDPGGAVYLSDGVFHRTQVETASGVVRNNDGAIYRFEPRTGKFETHIAYNFANPHGRVFDYWGNDLVTDATGNHTYFGPAFSGRIDYPNKHRELREFWKRPARPSPGTGLLTSAHFPDEFQGNLLNLNVISFQGIYRVKVIEDGSGLRGDQKEDLVSSSDPNFRPTAVNVGPDGAVYFADWHNPIIGHMQHHIRDPSRDHAHGRIYRLTHDGRPLAKPPKIDGQPIAALLDLLKEPENQTRELAKIELGKRDTSDVIAAVKKWIAALDSSEAAYQHHMTEALWVHQWHEVVDVELLKRVLESNDPRARAAATRVLCYWRDRVPDALELLARRADDEHPRVRLEAVRAASFFDSTRAAEVSLLALKHPTDYYIDYTLGETIRQLEPHWREALARGEDVAADNPAGLDYLLRSVATANLLKLPGNAALTALLARSDIADADRHRVLTQLAERSKISRAAALLEALQRGGDATAKTNVIRLLPQLTPQDLKPVRSRVKEIAARSDVAAVRQYALAGLATADKSFDAIWNEASVDLLEAVPLVYDPFIRARAYDKVIALLSHDDAAIRAAAMRAAASINRNQAQTFTAIAKRIETGRDIVPAAAALRVLPLDCYDRARCPSIAAAIVKWAKATLADQRTSREFLSTVQFAESLVPMLPKKKAARVLVDLRELRVAAFFVTALREQMRYDTSRLIVEAGKPCEINFTNTDLMPHNLTIVAPGQRERIGKLAMMMKPDQLDSAGRAYLPGDPAIIAATRLLEAGQSETLKLTAPSDEGEYEFVCTYPDHWQVMWGKLIVTKDIDAYLRSAPAATSPATRSAHQHAHAPRE